ncbi:MAG: DUF3526 domain-containing protein, partial [Lewinella sp.]|nr:DUF3526 domain-containing protein [Lewinella sp.]
TTPALSGLAIGQRDINPSLVSVTIRNLEEQKYATDLMNPMYQLLGNMDFSFVLFYFFPLIIIAFGYNLVSEEKEGGTWRLVLSQTPRPLQMLYVKMGVRYISVLSVLLLLLVIAKFYLQIPVDAAFAIYCLLAVLYISFWFCLVWLVVSFHRSSSRNALILLTAWVLLCMLLPAGLHALVVQWYPAPEAYATVLESRDGYHRQWDRPKEPTIDKFQQRYPQFSSFRHPDGEDFSWLWYYAMQQMGDEQAATAAKLLKEKLRQRAAFSRVAGWFVPTIHTQLTMNALSRSDLLSQVDFLEALEKFHEDKRLYFYPKIFTEAAVSDENWNDFTLEYHAQENRTGWLEALLPLLLAGIICMGWAKWNWESMPLARKL